MSFQIGNRSVEPIEQMTEGMKSYFGKIYNYMAGGLAVSGIVAYAVARTSLRELFYHTSANGVGYSLLGFIAILSPLALIFMISSALNRLNTARAQGMFWLFSALMGVSLSNIFLFYPQAVIFQAFLVTAGLFAALSLYGYTTNRSLASWGSFLFMGLIGVILASVVNLFLHSGTLAWGLSVLSVLIFVGLTAYDTQKLKYMYAGNDAEDRQQAQAISGALSLYLDFINLFQLILYFMDNRR